MSVNPKICDCPFTEWCHEPRQWLRSKFREEGHEEKVQDCDYYKMIEQMESEERKQI